MDRLLLDWPDVHVACVWLPQLPLRAEILRHPAWDGLPIVMCGGPGDARTVQLCSPEAELAGIRPGLPLREVLPLCQDAIVVQPDPVRVAVALEDALRQLQRVAPGVEIGSDEHAANRKRPGSRHGGTPAWLRESRLFVDLRGMQLVYNGRLARLESAIRSALPPLLRPSIGYAAGKFAAAVAARLAPANGCAIVPAAETVEYLDPLPVKHLPLPPNSQERLRLFGIHTIGQLARLPFSAVQAQFGIQGAHAWRLAQGEDDEPVIGQPATPIARAALECDDPLASLEMFHAALDQLLTRAFSSPSLRGGCSARQLRLRALLSDGSSWERSFTFKEPLSGKQAVRQALRSKLKASNMLPAAPAQQLAIELLGLGPETARQLPLFGSRIRQQRQLSEAARQLTARYGHSPLFQPVEVEPWSRIPERRWALTPFEP
jgi:DNA polymerase-4/protein ImuB